jgi:hypothetical protein
MARQGERWTALERVAAVGLALGSPDRRPFAVTYRRITCQFEGRTIDLVP